MNKIEQIKKGYPKAVVGILASSLLLLSVQFVNAQDSTPKVLEKFKSKLTASQFIGTSSTTASRCATRAPNQAGVQRILNSSKYAGSQFYRQNESRTHVKRTGPGSKTRHTAKPFIYY